MINNPFQMVVLIVLIVMISTVLKARYSYNKAQLKKAEDPESQRLRDEVRQLKERLAVLERITIEKENSLEREIERLRDH
ncbi:MAG TPA: hypothetical protein VF577_01130 [Allosphingosinicella sp.]